MDGVLDSQLHSCSVLFCLFFVYKITLILGHEELSDPKALELSRDQRCSQFSWCIRINEKKKKKRKTGVEEFDVKLHQSGCFIKNVHILICVQLESSLGESKAKRRTGFNVMCCAGVKEREGNASNFPFALQRARV